jgi:hypothetical protein
MRQTYLVLVIIDRIRRFFVLQSYFRLFDAILFRVWLRVRPFPQPVSGDSYRACVVVIECVCVSARVRNGSPRCVRSRCPICMQIKRMCVYACTNCSPTATHTHTHTHTHTSRHQRSQLTNSFRERERDIYTDTQRHTPTHML